MTGLGWTPLRAVALRSVWGNGPRSQHMEEWDNALRWYVA